MDKEKQYNLTIPSKRASIEKAVSLVEKVAKKIKLKEEEADNLAISVSEAVANAIIHGNKLNEKKKVIINISFKKNIIQIKIKDQGNGFDPKKLGNPLDRKNITLESGRGIFILKYFMDTVDFNFMNEGTEIILSKSYEKNNFKK